MIDKDAIVSDEAKDLEMQVEMLTREKEELIRTCEFLRAWYEFFFSTSEDFNTNQVSNAGGGKCSDLKNYAKAEHKKFTDNWRSENPNKANKTEVSESNIYNQLEFCQECGEFLYTFYCFYCGR